MRIALVAFAVMLAQAAPAQGASRESWDFARSGEMVQVAYGVPESDIVTIVFRCEGKPKQIEIVSTVLPAKPRKGQSLRTTLGNGAATAVYDGKLGHHSEHGFHFEASVAAEPKVVDILKSGTSLTISIPGKQRRVPLRGVAAPLAKFEAACFRKQ
jgi:hypothetical protein